MSNRVMLLALGLGLTAGLSACGSSTKAVDTGNQPAAPTTVATPSAPTTTVPGSGGGVSY
jgi:hypothetical protein